MTKKYHIHNMILMSKYKGQHGGKKGKKIRTSPPPPPPPFSGRTKSIFFLGCVPLVVGTCAIKNIRLILNVEGGEVGLLSFVDFHLIGYLCL